MVEKALLAADVVVFDNKRNVLLIKRKKEPFKDKYALPGGFVEEGEIVENAAKRELEEETGIKKDAKNLQRVGVYNEPRRDPRGRVVSFAFKTFVEKQTPLARDDAKKADWFPLERMPELAFDHNKIIEDAKETK